MMKIYVKDQNGVTLHTANKYCEEDIEVRVDAEELNITPTTEDQIEEGLYHKVSVLGESNLVPENIAEDKEIFGIKGTYKGTDTTDATATADDILEGKTAYVNKEKLEGTISEYDGTYEGNANEGIVITDAYHLCYGGHRQEIAQQLVDMCGAITNAYQMFYQCRDLTEIDLSNFDTSQCTDIYGMFYSCSNLTELDLSNFDTSKVTTMGTMFQSCGKMTELDLNNFDTSNVTNMYAMFYGCSNLTELDVSNWNTSNVTDMGSMFNGCSNLTELDLSNFDTSNVTNMYGTIMNCTNLIDLDLSGWDMSKITQNSYMLSGCQSLVNFKSFKNLGKGYTKNQNNYSSYVFHIDYSTKLSHESLIDLITNGLYDLNLTYDVTNGGTLYRQTLKIGRANMAKLTEEEIQIAIDKGWDVIT